MNRLVSVEMSVVGMARSCVLGWVVRIVCIVLLMLVDLVGFVVLIVAMAI